MPHATLFELDLVWDDAVYEPSADTVLLAEGVHAEPGMACLEMCCGVGLSALIMARDAGAAVATDVNPRACQTARTNAERNDLWLDVACMDLAAGLDAPFDRIACNPPYLPTSPEDSFPGPIDRAVSGGPDGSKISRRVIDEIADLLAPDGEAVLMVTSHQTVDELEQRARDAGLTWEEEETESVGGFEHLARIRLAHDPDWEPSGA